jgi:hypothetical protein
MNDLQVVEVKRLRRSTCAQPCKNTRSYYAAKKKIVIESLGMEKSDTPPPTLRVSKFYP